jgi:hypothetical protein
MDPYKYFIQGAIEASFLNIEAHCLLLEASPALARAEYISLTTTVCCINYVHIISDIQSISWAFIRSYQSPRLHSHGARSL